jgi:hypothetical protein
VFKLKTNKKIFHWNIGLFFSLPLFKIFKYSFGSDENRREINPGLITNLNLPEKTIGNLKRKFKKERTETLKQNNKNTLDKNSKNYRKKRRLIPSFNCSKLT